MQQRIFFDEVVTRDGCRNEPAFVPTDAKVAPIDAPSASGCAKVEGTSFTSAKAIPMLRDAREVMGRMRRVPGAGTMVLVPDVPGAEGYDTGIDLPRLLAAARSLPASVGHDMPGQIAKAGLVTDLHPTPSHVAELRASAP